MFKKLILLLVATPLLSLSAIWNPYVNVSQIQDASLLGGPVLDVNILNNGISVYSTPDSALNVLIKSAFYTFGSGWNSPVIISDTSLNPFDGPNYINQGDPTVSLNSSNYAVAAWEGAQYQIDIDDFVGVIISATRLNGVWSPVQIVSNVNDLSLLANGPQNPYIDVSDSGLTVVVWTELRNNTDRFIMANFLPFGGTWGTPIELSNPAVGSRENTPRVQINSSNNAVAVWKAQNEFSQQIIGASTYNSSTGLWTTVTLDPGTTDTSLPIVGIDDAGNAVAVWTRQIGVVDTIYEVVSSSFNFATQTWGPMIIIDTGTDLEPILPYAYVVVDPSGTATAIWNKRENDIQSVFSSRLRIGGTWSPIEIISNPLNNASIGFGITQTPISVDRQGNVIVMMQDYDSGFMQSVTRFATLGWQPLEPIAFLSNTSHHEIRFGSCGFAMAQWSNAARFPATAQAADNFSIFPPPSNLRTSSCCQKFATQKRCVNILEWTPSSSCILYYEIFRDGVFIGVVPGDVATFTDPLCNSDQPPFTYTIVGVNIFGVASAPISAIVRARV